MTRSPWPVAGAEVTASEFDAQNSPFDVDTPQLRQAKAAAGIGNCPRSDADAESVSGGLPDLTLPCLGGGRNVNLAGLPETLGMPLVINFWAQYCGPCRDEAGYFAEVNQDLSDQVVVLGIDFQDEPGKAIAFADELGMTYPQLADPAAATRGPFQLAALPRTVFVDESGAIAYVEYHPITSLDQLTGLIAEHLHIENSAGRGS
ncbi:MAG: TlpA family protein disulfide reductase [Nocardioidaceae bacterium]